MFSFSFFIITNSKHFLPSHCNSRGDKLELRPSITYFLLGAFSASAIIFTLWFSGMFTKIVFDEIVSTAEGETREPKNNGTIVNIKDTLPSPDGKYVATVYLEEGGTEPRWCFQRVSIDSKKEPFDINNFKHKGGFSFDISCENKVDLQWQAERELQISYSVNTDDAGVSIFQKPLSKDRQVKIKYFPKY